jgi:hypothetical protein
MEFSPNLSFVYYYSFVCYYEQSYALMLSLFGSIVKELTRELPGDSPVKSIRFNGVTEQAVRDYLCIAGRTADGAGLKEYFETIAL